MLFFHPMIFFYKHVRQPFKFVLRAIETVLVSPEIKEIIVNAKPWLFPFESKRLFELAKLNPGLGCIVEIGSAWGGTSCLLSLASKQSDKAKVYCVDPWPVIGGGKHYKYFCAARSDFINFNPKKGPLFGQFIENVKKNGAPELVKPIQAKSLDAAKGWSRPIKLLFIDGVHDYVNVVADIRAWGPFLARGGIIAFHDYWLESLEVKKAVNELIVASTRFSRLKTIDTLAWAEKIR